jgi:ParB family chromosome partitioning protein
VVDRQQSDLFAEALAEELAEPAPQAAEQGQGEDAPARRGRRRRVPDGPEPHAGEPLQVPIDRLDGDPLHPREDYPQESLEDLARDIAERGVLQAIVVAPADAQGRYRIRFGVQRWRAARLAGLTDVPVAVRVRPCEAYDQVAENLKRHGLSPLELARFIRSRVQAGESNAHIARKLAMDTTTVAHHLSLLELPPVLSTALDSGRCTSPRTLHELHKLHDERPDAVAALLAGGLPVTREAVAALRTAVAASSGTSRPGHTTPPDLTADLIGRSQRLCDRLDRLLIRLVADAGADRLPGGQVAALRQRLAALLQRLDG